MTKEETLQMIREIGAESAKEMTESWLYRAQLGIKDKFSALDEKGNPVRETFGNALNYNLWEEGFEYIDEQIEELDGYEDLDQDEIGYTFFEGVWNYVDNNWKK